MVLDSIQREVNVCEFEEIGMNEDELRDALSEQAQWDEDGIGDTYE
jgi:hypothetical protein